MSHPVHTPEVEISTLQVGDTVWYTRPEDCATVAARDTSVFRAYHGVYDSAGFALQAARFRHAMHGVHCDLFAIAHTVTAVSADEQGAFTYLRPDWSNVVRG